MNTITTKDIHDQEASELSERMIDGHTLDKSIPLPVLLDLVDRLIGLLSRGGVKRRLEHLEQVVNAQQQAIRLLVERLPAA